MTVEPVPAPAKAPSHVLLTVLGTNPRAACYSLAGRSCEALIAPLALLRLLPSEERPDCVIALCTEEAGRDSLPLLMEQLPPGIGLQEVAVPSGYSQHDINTFLTSATEAIPRRGGEPLQLTLDVTHGFRHFSFLTYLAGLYLVSLRDLDLRGAWYGLLRQGEESPFLDLRPLLELPRWMHALQVLADTGSALPMAAALEVRDGPQEAATMARELRAISQGYLSGLPLELGRQVTLFRAQRLKGLRKLLRERHQLPLAAELVSQLDGLLQPFELQSHGQGSGWKAKLPLTQDELQRQGRIIDALFRHGDDGMAVGLLDEWTVSWAAWCLDDCQDWLKFPRRRFAAGQLGALKGAAADEDLKLLLTAEQQQLGLFWGFLTSLRNGYHHHGMRPEDLIGNTKVSKELQQVRSYWEATLRACPRLSLSVDGASAASLLVSPIGNRPGVLSSALHACRSPDRADPAVCLVICSTQSQPFIAEAVSQAGYRGEIVPLLLEDPHGGHAEIRRLTQGAREALFRAGEVYVNVTGGTTLMGLAAQALANQAARFTRPVHRFGLIDRRPPGEQEADPYQVGEPFWLQDSEEADY